jgi:predicted enzyme related to lactoylglutathione lyase
MAFSPTRGFGVDEVLAEEVFSTSYRYVSAEFQPAADKLLEIAGEAKQPVPKLSLLVLYATDLSKSKQFYETLGLQFAAERHPGGPEHFACPLGESVFELYPRKADAPLVQAVRIGFQVPSVDVAIARLQVAGIQPVRLPENSAWGRRAVIRDPDGNTIEITSPSQV